MTTQTRRREPPSALPRQPALAAAECGSRLGLDRPREHARYRPTGLATISTCPRPQSRSTSSSRRSEPSSPGFVITFDPDAVASRVAELERELGEPGFWDDQAR